MAAPVAEGASWLAPYMTNSLNMVSSVYAVIEVLTGHDIGTLSLAAYGSTPPAQPEPANVIEIVVSGKLCT